MVVPKPETGKDAQTVASQALMLRGVVPLLADPERTGSASPTEAQDCILEWAIEQVRQ